MDNVFIELAGCRLRKFVNTDVRYIVELNKNERVTQQLLEGTILSKTENAERFIQDALVQYRLKMDGGCWAAESKGRIWEFQGWFNLSPILPGTVSAEQYNLHENALELGSRLSTSAWGSTMSIQLGTALLDHAFKELDRPYILIHCLPVNRSAIYCARLLGFQYKGTVLYFGKISTQFILSSTRYSSWNKLPMKQRKKMALSPTKYT